MSQDSDRVFEDAIGELRVLLSAASQLGEQMARRRERALQQAARESEQRSRELQSRYEAERLAARGVVAGTQSEQWWQQARPDQVAHAWELANAWADQDPVMDQSRQAMAQQLQQRWGLDPRDTQADPQLVARLVQERQNQLAQSQREQVEAAELIAQADREDRSAALDRDAAQFEPDPDDRAAASRRERDHTEQADTSREAGQERYDTAARRQEEATRLLDSGVDEDAVHARYQADVSQAEPAAAATSTPRRRRGAVARKATGRGATQRVERNSRGR